MKINIKIKGKKEKTVPINTEFIKLDSFLKFCGVADTGGIAKILIKEGLIKVNGKQCFSRGKKIYKIRYIVPGFVIYVPAYSYSGSVQFYGCT